MGVALDYSTGVVVYNLDHFQAVGLKPAAELERQWDWNTLRDYSTRLTQKGGSEMKRSGIWISNSLENGWYTFAVASGGSFFTKELDQCTLASPEATAGLEFVLGMLKDGITATPDFMAAASKANPQAGAVFINGA